MNFPRFWAKGAKDNFVCWRWSERSLDEAKAFAQEAAQKLAERFRSGDVPVRHGYYSDRPMREPVLQELKSSNGELAAVVTRNSYGCLVLNTNRVMFVDIDLPEPRPDGLLKRLFGGPKVPSPDNAQSNAVEKAEAWVRAHPGWGWRIYRTRAGLRLLATHDVFDAEAAVSQAVFEALGADPLYRKLCKAQKCFRARLTPKPWRCGLKRKPDRWPWLDAKAELRFQKWEAQYQSVAAGWATCELIKQIGNASPHPEVQLILNLHDEATRIGSKLALA
jgi:hypothetical protein